jgi:hypothetical protein
MPTAENILTPMICDFWYFTQLALRDLCGWWQQFDLLERGSSEVAVLERIRAQWESIFDEDVVDLGRLQLTRWTKATRSDIQAWKIFRGMYSNTN